MASASAHVVTVPCLADGSIGVDLSTDSAGRPIVVTEPPAAAAGLLHVGDVILEINGHTVGSVEMIQAQLQHSAAERETGGGAALALKVLRPPPILQPIQWSTSALSVSAGATLDVPLTVQEPAMGRYAFECSDGRAIEFTLIHRPNPGPDGQTEVPLLPPSTAAAGAVRRGDGFFRVLSPGVVIARLDNSGSTFSTVTIKCVVAMTPMSQAVAAEVAAIRTALEAQASHLSLLGGQEDGLLAQERELERKLLEMRIARQVTAEIRATDGAAAADLESAARHLEAVAAVAANFRGGMQGETLPGAALATAEKAIGDARKARAAAHSGRQSVEARTAQAEEAALRREHERAITAAAVRRAADLRPLLPLAEVYAAFSALTTHCCGPHVALRSYPRVDAVFQTSREDLFVLECTGFDLHDVSDSVEGVPLASPDDAAAYCLLLQGHIIPLVDPSSGSSGGMDHFPDAYDTQRACKALGAAVLDFYDQAVYAGAEDTQGRRDTNAEEMVQEEDETERLVREYMTMSLDHA